uniref:Protein kinase domain-containing protein n=1 Tax=Nelumbo nucifera TaxID=4432 RepID=A0A822Z9W9_NELNU|nr:TPA_asm: hypothetical protein HUJ06_015990 [Nelumbo nucifera]
MTATVEVATENKDEEKKNVLVGIRMDRYGRDLINWALIKVSEPRDRIVAVNICRESDNESGSKEHSSMADYLKACQGLCNVKQVDLTGYISRGNSVRKALVREAKKCTAITVVVGVSRQHSLGGWVSVAKYCAKRLPPTTSILAVHNGKIVFESASKNQFPELRRDPKPSFYSISISRFKRQTTSRHAELTKIVVQNSEDESRNRSKYLKYNSFSVVQESNNGTSRSIAHFGGDVLEPKPGWPLLRRAFSVTSEVLNGAEARNMSVVQWVMNLPNRSPPVTPKTQHSFDSNKEEKPCKKKFCNCVDRSNSNCLSAWGELPKELELFIRTNSSNCRWFSYKELKSSTSQFSSECLIGKGGCSHVYRGCLTDGKPVAIKISKSSKEAWKDFALEVEIISSLNHKNITPLIGICIEDNALISVYDFFSKGSLEEVLHNKCVLSWEVRLKVAVGVAEALNYLHNGCSRHVVHRDVKSSNILLSDDFEPQLTDFGLAVWAPTTPPYDYETHSGVVGTFGYIAPDYFMYGKVSHKIDVYSFGVVLLELISGRKAIGMQTPNGQTSLVMWANPLLERGDQKGLLDPKLAGNFDDVRMRRMVLAATLCITRSSHLRPNLSEILEVLKGVKDVEEWGNSCVEAPTESDDQEGDEVYLESSSVDSHPSLALLDVDDGATSYNSVEQNFQSSMEDYLKGRWSRSSSVD